MRITFVICTYNRAFILTECLESILTQVSTIDDCEVLVIDNHSSDNTLEVVRRMQLKYPVIRLVIETKIGLSHARNRAIKDGLGEWLVYIDDDARLRAGYVKQLLKLIESEEYDCFGGMYYAWFRFGKPKWLPDNFGNKTLIQQSVGRIDGTRGWLSGGNFVIKKKVLREVGGFCPELGMSGNKIGYGEESQLQKELLKNGYRLGFDPDLSIDHAVLSHKLKLSWHLRHKYVMGKYSRKLSNGNRRWNEAYMIFKSLLGGIFKHLPLGLFKLMKHKNYYYEQLILDTFGPTFWYVGYFRGIKNKKDHVYGREEKL